MKKHLFFIFAMLASCFSTAQITVNRADFALSATAKDSAMSKRLTISGVIAPTFGANQTWDYTNLRDSTPDLYYYGYITQPTPTNRPMAFEMTNLQQDYHTRLGNFVIPTRLYSLLNDNGYFDFGLSTPDLRFSLQNLTGSVLDSLIFPASNNVFSAVAPRYRFPINYRGVWQSNIINTSNFFLTVTGFGLNSAPCQRVQRVIQRDTVVGWGTLRLRNPTTGAPINFNVLLTTTQRITIDSFFLNGSPAPAVLIGAFGLQQGRRDTTASQYFCGVGFKAPLLAFVQNGSQNRITDAFRAILPSLNLTTSAQDITDFSVKTKVFPNPTTTEGVTFEFEKSSEKDWNIMIYDLSGRMMNIQTINGAKGLTTFRLPLGSQFSAGNYFYVLSDENSVIRANGKFLVQ